MNSEPVTEGANYVSQFSGLFYPSCHGIDIAFGPR